MSGMNFFSWIRDGVRQSVVMGVSDAVEQLGAPPAGEEPNQQVLSFLQASPTANKTARLSGTTKKTTTGRKRLGKSLKDIGEA